MLNKIQSTSNQKIPAMGLWNLLLFQKSKNSTLGILFGLIFAVSLSSFVHASDNWIS